MPGNRTRLARSAAAAALAALARPCAAGAAEPAAYRLGVELDPLPFFARGFSVHSEYKPAPLPRLRVTLGAFGFRDEPAADSENAGFTRTTRAVEVSAQYFAIPYHAGGLFSGLYVFGYGLRYEYASVSTTAHRYELVPALATGFQWLPWSKGPYITPWVAAGLPLFRSDEAVIAGHRFHDPAFHYVLAAHVGWEFAL